jgi:hypothetical protein
MRTRVLPLAIALSALPAAGALSPALEKQFARNVQPYVTKYCVGCHSGQMPAASLDLKSYQTTDAVLKDYPRWDTVHTRMAAKEMPPKPVPAPPEAESKKVLDWISAVRAEELKKHAGDPGSVPARRLSNAEYNYTIRDLTGQDLRPTKEFPVDPANLAGFDNSSESLTMSSALLKKYLEAARMVGDHMVLTPDGIDFASHPMLAETDRDKYPIQRIVKFYLSQPTDYADYFEAAWRYKNRVALKKPNATLASTAAEMKISAKYMPVIWALIEEPAAKAKDEVGPVAKLLGMWNGLPAPGSDEEVLKKKFVEMRDFAVKIRQHTAMQFLAPVVRGLPAQSQPLLNWKLKQYSLHRREFDAKDLLNDTETAPEVPVIPRYAGLHQEAGTRWAALSAKARAGDEDLIVPAAERAKYEASFARFANVFPDVFYVTERGRFFPDDSDDKGRLLSAGYHSVMGFYRDDRPLMELILDDKGQKQLDGLWAEFEYIADYTGRTFVQYFFNQSGEVLGKGAESASDRPVGNEVTDEPVIMGLKAKYLAKAAADAKSDPIAPAAIQDQFDGINARLRTFEKIRVAAEQKHLEAVLRFAARAYRRPLTKAESDDILVYYKKIRTTDALSHEEAIRDSIVSVLMSPHYLYRLDLDAKLKAASEMQTVAMNAAPNTAPVSGYALASRLSYFLWSSMPDAELMKHAAAGDLQRPDVLMAQTRRMLKDERTRNFATEFAGNWLDFRRFENYNSVDRDRFPTFTNDLRESMFEEPIRFVQDVVLNNRSVLDMLYGKYTFVNPLLAKHYGMPEMKGTKDTWVKVDDATPYQRGGLLPMAVFLTASSPGLRTSPVKRGYWVVHRLLGETIPPPPPVVPELPHDESKTDRPLREVLAAHRANPVCAACHARFDSFGLAFEGFGPTGEARVKDLAGRPIDASATFPGGVQGAGMDGVQAFIRGHRQNDFVDGMARKLLSYALNRSLQLSDEGLIDKMKARLAANDNRFGAMVEAIVTSPQFLNKRRAEVPARSVAQAKSELQSGKGE